AADGFTPGELGITTGRITAAQLAQLAPTVTLRRPAGRVLRDVRVTASKVLFEDRTAAAVRQRVTFEYSVEFDSTTAFGWRGKADEVVAGTIDVAVDAAGATHRASGLFH